MADAIRQLSEILGEIYNKIHHLYPSQTGVRVLDWLVESETITYSETELTTLNVEYPIYWAPTFEFSDPFMWDEQWGAAAWGAVAEAVSLPYDDARYVDWDDGNWYYNIPKSESAFLWGKTTWGTNTWIALEAKNWS